MSSIENTDPLTPANANDWFKNLLVVDRMEIGPAKIEKKRVVTPYKIIQNGREDINHLIYHFDEAVFHPDDPNSINLANLMTAQGAINYGLFCKEMVFKGLFDEVDQQFILDMSINTAQEIYAKKFLEYNHFLLGAAAKTPVIHKENYLQAKLLFDQIELKPPKKPVPELAKPDRQKIAVLSSGGKDSLLSFGLLQELGYDVHPIFVNESGRHWYTALNSHRYFKENYLNTGRVWTNCDRVYNWVIRHFPFIRQDFQRIRSDEYPIRLYTVPVFLFGVLAVVRKRGISRVVIGDEYDTTRKLYNEGVLHYDGLYDQSRYFDLAMSQYYQQKKWGISQFSIIRPLSEIFILKILTERYPKLQEQQISCHLAHIENERVKPCGNCEKCRRIVGMLSAIGADPARCGYLPEHIQRCLNAIMEHGVHQEIEGAQHMVHLLKQRGFKLEGTHAAIPHPEVMSVRIHPEYSPIEEIPVDLRAPLFKIFMEYAEDTLKAEGAGWKKIKLFDEPAMMQKFKFE
ncbi:hypothetical protein L0128_23510 [candidate division KSB1 bacterium]|nr:hypothetical protein [candidate division KSB1 bacterium]